MSIIGNLPSEAADRKQYPIATGVLDYFPLAIVALAHVSYIGNQQHHPGKPLHWDRTKSTDEADALMRHFKDRGTLDTDGIRHSAKMAWRALALLQKEIEQESVVEEEEDPLQTIWAQHWDQAQADYLDDDKDTL